MSNLKRYIEFMINGWEEHEIETMNNLWRKLTPEEKEIAKSYAYFHSSKSPNEVKFLS